MSTPFEHSETTFVFEHHAKTVELYTTSRQLWLRAVARNPNYLQAQELNPGYRLLYSLDQVRSPEKLLAPRPGGDEARRRLMTPRELETAARRSKIAAQAFFKQ